MSLMLIFVDGFTNSEIFNLLNTNYVSFLYALLKKKIKVWNHKSDGFYCFLIKVTHINRKSYLTHVKSAFLTNNLLFVMPY